MLAATAAEEGTDKMMPNKNIPVQMQMQQQQQFIVASQNQMQMANNPMKFSNGMNAGGKVNVTALQQQQPQPQQQVLYRHAAQVTALIPPQPS